MIEQRNDMLYLKIAHFLFFQTHSLLFCLFLSFFLVFFVSNDKKEGHKYDVDLKPLEADKKLVVFGDDYISDKFEALHLKTKWSWSGDTMTIKSAEDKEWFYVKGNAWSLSETRIVYGLDGNPLFVIAHESWWNPLNDSQAIFDCRGIQDPKEAAKVKKDKSKLLFVVKSNFGNSKQTTTVTNQVAEGPKEQVKIVGKCSFANFNCAIWRDGDHKTGGIPLAKFSSPLELQNFLGYKSLENTTQDFYLTVAPGADIALMLAFVLAIREMDESYNG